MNTLLKNVSQTLPKEIRKDKVRDALRLALQSSIAAAITFTVVSFFNLPEMFLALISAVLVVEPSIGNTFDQAKGRILATILGSAIGFGLVAIIPWGYGTALSLLIIMFIMNAIASLNPSWRYGVVAAVAISLGSEESALDTSIDRLIAMGIGIGIGLLITAIVWPEKAITRANNHLRKALNAACDRFEVAYQNNKSSEKENADHIANNFNASLGNAKEAAAAISLDDKSKIFKQIQATENLYNSILIIHRVGQNADTTMLSEEAGIQQNAEKLKDRACEMIGDLVNKEVITDEKFSEFEALVKQTKNEVNTMSKDKQQNMFRHAFVFGITEINDSLKVLKDLVAND